jgi:hypothetical protein
MSDRPTDSTYDSDEESRARASLQGKGWEILRGEALPPGSPPAVTDDSDAAPAPGASPDDTAMNWVAAPELSKLQGRAPAAADLPVASPPPADSALPVEKRPAETEAIPRIEAFAMNASGQRGYAPSGDLDALTPVAPEELGQPPADSDPLPSGEPEDGGGIGLRIVDEVPPLEADGAVIRPQDVRIDAGRLTPVSGNRRPDASDLFSRERETLPADDLLQKFVTDERLEQLWTDLETLQQDLVDKVQGDRTLMDTYQKELLQASALLLQDRANYDDVRAILYRIRTDLARDEKVRRDITKYKPQILWFLVFAFLLWMVLMALEPLFSRFMADVIGLRSLSMIYHPTLFGMLGAIVNAYFTLNKHAIQLRDFDPAHMSWYLMNPIIGLIMGLLMTLVFGTGIVSTIGVGVLEQSQSDMLGQYPFLLWVLCFLAGYNQNVVLRLLQRTFNMLRGESEQQKNDDQESTQTPPNPAN